MIHQCLLRIFNNKCKDPIVANTLWTQGLPKEDKEEFTKILQLEIGSKVWKRLLTVIKTKRESLEASERTLDIYEKANWAYQQAHNNGARQMLVFVENLLKG